MHIGIIMDGNGRWATEKGLPRRAGHMRGASRVTEIVKSCPQLGVEGLTLYAFSTENWKRAAHEVESLMRIFRWYLRSKRTELHENNVSVRFLGDPTPLAADIRKQMDALMALTAGNTGLHLNIAINYGGRDEILRAVKSIAAKTADGVLSADDISEDLVSEHLDTRGQSDPDLIIRTAGEMRLSNFMLWQSAYTEFVFLNELWPDFTAEMFRDMVDIYAGRTRQFGAVATARAKGF